MAAIREVLTLEDKFSQNMAKYIKLSETGSASTKALNKATKDLSQQARLLSAAHRVEETASRSNVATQKLLTAEYKKQTAAARAAAAEARAQTATLKLQEQQEKATKTSTDSLAGSLKNLLRTYLGFQTIKGLVNLSDQMTGTTARLNMIVDDGGSVDELEAKIMASANRARASYLDTAAAVAQMGVLAGDTFGNNDELIAFTETINKQFAIAGTTAEGTSAAMLQITQAMSSGVLRGEELNSVFEQAPNIVQNIADYLGVGIGEIREMASEGQITSEIFKNSMLAAAQEVDEQFQQMPMTWGQVWNQFQNIAIQALEPLLDVISQFAQFVGNNIETIVPLVYGFAAAIGVLTAAYAIWTAVTWLQVAANRALVVSMLTNPITWIIVAIAAIIGAFVAWAQSVGGFEVAWLIVMDNVLYAWDTLKAGFFTGVYWLMDLWDNFSLTIQGVGVSIANWMGDMKVNVLNILQTMVNGAIGIINQFIGVINKVLPNAIEPIKELTFAANAAVENEAAKQQRELDLRVARRDATVRINTRANELAEMWTNRDADHAARQTEILAKQLAASQEEASQQAGVYDFQVPASEDTLGQIAGDTSAIKKEVSMSEEDIKSLVDMAERQYVNNINLTSQAPVITVNATNNSGAPLSAKDIANAVCDILIEQSASSSVRTTARVF